MVSGRISAERKRVARGTERADHFLAVAGAAGLHHQEHLGLVHVQPRAQPLVAYLEHVGAEIGQVAEQPGQGSRTIGQPAAERQIAAGRGQTVPEQLGQQQRVDVAPDSTATTGGTKPRECSSRAATPAAPAGSTTCLA